MDMVLSLVVLAAFILMLAAYFVWRRGNAKQAGLMAVLAIVALANVLIWIVPDGGGTAPVDRIEAAGATESAP